jgi:ATP-binding cassette subfamily B protein
MSTHFGAKIKLSMQADYISKMFKLPLNFFETRLMGDIIQRNNDYDRLEAFIMSTGFEFVLAFFQLIIFGIILAYYNFTIFIVFLASSLIYIMWILFFWSIRKKMDIRNKMLLHKRLIFIYGYSRIFKAKIKPKKYKRNFIQKLSRK